jgi:putative ABC transport system permease protein
MQVVIVEGIFIGLVSWLLGTLLAYPLSRAMSVFIGVTSLWLIIVLILSVFASYIPARNASRLSVREVLAYE